MQKASEMTVENLDHLGLVAGLIDEIRRFNSCPHVNF